jgi:hypothetical protein
MFAIRQFVKSWIAGSILAAAIFVAPGQVIAAGCSGSGCNGKDPGAAGCSGANSYTVYYSDVNYGGGNLSARMRVSLRYSPTCGTNWAKVDVIQSNPANYSFQISLTLKDVNYNTIPGTSYGTVGRSAYGNMYYAPTTPVRACGALDFFGGGYQCTSAG